MDQHKKNFIVQALRRASYRWQGRWQAENRSRVIKEVKGKKTFYDYFCESCGLIVPKKDSRMDHIVPIVDPEKGFEGFSDAYMDRFFPYAEGWQRLCLDCDHIKTTGENEIRTEVRRNSKKKKKKT